LHLEFLVQAAIAASASMILVYSANNLYLAYSSRRYRSPERVGLEEYPLVSIQIPVYNEKEIVTPLMESLRNLDWPREALEILILDDSTDETKQLLDEEAARTPSARVVRRGSREGYKAGALEEGLKHTRAKYLVFFDADFTPRPQFLKRVIPIMEKNRRLGFLQVRWGHLNEGENLVTRAAALALDWHHFIEQTGRASSSLLINFNGSAGVFRREAVESAGGWSWDTLSEDLDISYRVQLHDWGAAYLKEVEAPGLIPSNIWDFLNQQARWIQGSIQCARKLLVKTLASNLGWRQKAQSILHLTGYTVHLWSLILLLTSTLYLGSPTNANTASSILLTTVGAIGLLSQLSTIHILKKCRKTPLPTILQDFFYLLLITLGSSLRYSAAITQGLFNSKLVFTRTPKGPHPKPRMGPGRTLTLIAPELVLATFIAFKTVNAIQRASLLLAIYMFLYACGGLLVAVLKARELL